MKFLGFEEVKSELVRLKKENEDLGYKLYWSKESYKRLHEENEELKIEIKYLKEPKAILNIDVTSGEHKCTPECFEKHVIKAIQDDYDSCSKKNKPYFLMYWYDNLSEYYPWLKTLFSVNGKIGFYSK